jgi:hypothetical protein
MDLRKSNGPLKKEKSRSMKCYAMFSIGPEASSEVEVESLRIAIHKCGFFRS